MQAWFITHVADSVSAPSGQADIIWSKTPGLYDIADLSKSGQLPP